MTTKNVDEIKEELGIITSSTFGMNDRGWIMLSFTVHMHIYSVGVSLTVDDAVKLLKEHSISDVKHLEGKPCIMQTEGSISRFKDLKSIP